MKRKDLKKLDPSVIIMQQQYKRAKAVIDGLEEPIDQQDLQECKQLVVNVEKMKNLPGKTGEDYSQMFSL